MRLIKFRKTSQLAYYISHSATLKPLLPFTSCLLWCHHTHSTDAATCRRGWRGRILRSSCCLTFSQSAARRLGNYESTRLIIFPPSFVTTEEKNRNNFPVIERRITGSCRVWCLRPVWRVVYGYSLLGVCRSTLHFFFWICWCQYSILLIYIYLLFFFYCTRCGLSPRVGGFRLLWRRQTPNKQPLASLFDINW